MSSSRLRHQSGRITGEYMAATAMMTLRIDPDLLARLKARAKREGRSVSAEVVRMIAKEVGPVLSRRTRPTTTKGMFADLEAPTLEEFKRLRRSFSAAIVTRGGRGRRSA